MVSRSTALRFAFLLLASPLAAMAQVPSSAPASAVGGKKPLTIADYSKWRSIDGADLSPDGKWVAYTLRYTNVLPADAKPALHIMNLDTNQDIEVPNAHDASFSSDSRWVVYQVDSVAGAAWWAGRREQRRDARGFSGECTGCGNADAGCGSRCGREHAATHGTP